MAVKILEIKQESCPAARLIGKRYQTRPDWNAWRENDRFAALEAEQALPINGGACIAAVHIVDGMPEYWIGMFFPEATEIPEGFEAVDIEPLKYAVCYLSDKAQSSEFDTMDTHDQCLEELKARHLTRREDDWCFRRYNSPGFTTPDEAGNVTLEYAISIL